MEQRIRASRYRVSTLGDRQLIGKLVDGPFGTQIKVDDYRKAGIPLLRVSNCRENEVSDDNLVYIDPKLHARLSRSEVLPGDVVFTKTGHILGYAAVFPPRHDRANMSSHLVLMRTTGQLLPEFLAAYLRTNAGRDQVYRWGQKATKPELNTIEIRRFLVPVPTPAQQKALLARLETARADWKRTLSQADELLAGIDGIVLNALGLEMPNPGHASTYAVCFKDVRSAQRIYPDYFHPERMTAIRAVQSRYPAKQAAKLFEIADFIRDVKMVDAGDDYLGLADVQPNTGEKIASTEEDGKGNCFVYRKGDVLFARLRPYLNKVYRAESDGVCSTEFHVIRIRPGRGGRPGLIPDYLAAVLRSSILLAQTRHMMTGNTHPRLANDDVVNLVVPVPNRDVQENIAREIAHRRANARRMRDRAARIWDEGQRQFEDELLGPAR